MTEKDQFDVSELQGRSYLADKDFTPAEVQYLVDFALHLKHLKKRNIPHYYLEGKNIALLFEKTSTRTRSAFTTAAIDLGAHPEFMGAGDIQLGKKESIEDTAKVLGSMFDGIEFRGFAHKDVEELAKYAGVPVWNGLTDEWHPTQMIADFMTVKENFGHLKGLTLTFVGDGRNNMANSLLVAGAMLGVNIHILAPKELHPAQDVVNIAQKFANESGAKLLITDDIDEGVKGSNVIYTDVWVSMGETNWEERVKLLTPYQVNMDMMKKTGTPDDQLIFMHCLPAFHDTKTSYGQDVAKKYGITEMEVTDEVFRSKYARQFEEAENRMHSIKAMMAATLGDLFIPKM
ncbi:ornithine carbamoyltransferase [Furfurilactobacillus milii]|uniref:Ornithine carbamoyltransferase n=1 Tax=Furfurilactobacillus milii TaxID=2888272 RepID=A0ABT6D6H4_9LACO|nr:ornithine carbamoyltransferase [Furfurilactobacillus milii]QLE66316.1 Ornithine carbamoyltransferase [Furfurilactobacillus rossiae]MCF6159772.1 ornithine carbamoyltransferase [Furfurilactobacillus milii]MCF6163143.1 ornithine carbamoyltransferase [Furfurilactobacillus milii]MDF9912734.1 ornithine carbamoyltransferase [Furfurilactobacillus milii]QLE68746.1 Ornithine carbamoyltransferase [Furfurilactobacillus rossiae]